MSDTPDPINDNDLTKPADQLAQNLENATDGVEDVVDNLERMVDQGLTVAEEKIDGFLKGLDNFLGKF